MKEKMYGDKGKGEMEEEWEEEEMADPAMEDMTMEALWRMTHF